VSDDVQRSLGRIEGTLASILANQTEDGQRLVLVEKRVTSLEKWQTRIVAYGAGVSGCVAALFALVKVAEALSR
jgi:D-arabinose 5-phosphate isomerase GutQ